MSLYEKIVGDPANRVQLDFYKGSRLIQRTKYSNMAECLAYVTGISDGIIAEYRVMLTRNDKEIPYTR